MLDRWAFGMSKIEGAGGRASNGTGEGSVGGSAGGSKPGSVGDKGIVVGGGKRPHSEDLVAEVGNVSLASDEMDTRVGFVGRTGPSLLSQQAPGKTGSTRVMPMPVGVPVHEVAGSLGSAMSVDEEGVGGREGVGGGEEVVEERGEEEGLLDGTERITVKIADLGNGRSLSSFPWAM